MSDEFMQLPTSFGRGGGGGRRNNRWNQQARQYGGGRGRGRGGRGRGRGGRGGQRRGPRNNDNRDFTDEIEVLGTRSEDTLCVAIQGCCHGELDAIYNRLKRYEETCQEKIDLLLCCGDFQSLRNEADYHSFAVPPKYRSMGSFHRYYSGEKEAPIPTIFIGGNHEASQPLHELYYGGWVAPNIYYLGAAGVVNVAGVRIGGVSGIYKSHDYTQTRFEMPPYDRSSLRSVYHVRNTDVYRLKCLDPENDGIDIMLSHDWPQGIEQHGDTNTLLRQKPFFRDEVQRNVLGSPPNRELLDSLKPKWWFSAHLHVKFKARVNHAPSPRADSKSQSSSSVTAGLVPSQVKQKSTKPEGLEQGVSANDDSKATDDATSTQFRSLESSKACNEPDLTDMMTQFLALDKCLPRRRHLSILHVPCNKGRKDVLEYDPEWLAVLKKTHHLTSAQKRRAHCPREPIHVTKEEIEAMRATLASRGQDGIETPLAIPKNFSQTVSPQASNRNRAPLPMMGNPQTDELLDLLDLNHVITVPYANISIPAAVQDDNEIDLEMDNDDGGEVGGTILDYKGTSSVPSRDDNEIDLDDEEGDAAEGKSAEELPPQPASVDDNEIDLDEEEDAPDDTKSDTETSPAYKKARANSS